MNNLRILIILFFLLGVVIFFQVVSPFTSRKTEKKELSSKSIIKKKETFPSPTQSKSLISTPSTQEPTNTPSLQISLQGMRMYKYPNATVISENSTELILESSDDSDVITDWYRNVFVSENMTANATAKTKTNGEVLNKLMSSKSGKKTIVEISKKSEEAIVHIKINLITP